jgi:hypothetical protein
MVAETNGEWVQFTVDYRHRIALASRRRNKPTGPSPTLSAFHHKVADLLVRCFRSGIYNVPITWERVDWSRENAVRFPVRAGRGLDTWDFDTLTRLVIAAHDECIRFGVEPSGPGMLALTFHQRLGREGPMHSRHPTIETAIEDYRR